VTSAMADERGGEPRDEPEPLRQEGAQGGSGGQSRKRCAIHNASTAAEPASRIPSGSWFYPDVKVSLSALPSPRSPFISRCRCLTHALAPSLACDFSLPLLCQFCDKCGMGCTAVGRLACGECGGTAWNFAGVSRGATQGMQDLFEGHLSVIARGQDLTFAPVAHSDDVLVDQEAADGGLSRALAALARRVEAARAHEGERSRRWDFRSAHLGAGICEGMTHEHVLRACLLWSQTDEDQRAARFDVSKAFRRASDFADYSEEHFDRFFNEPMTIDDPAYRLVSQAISVHLAPWHVPGPYVLRLAKNAFQDFGVLAGLVQERGMEHVSRAAMRYVWTLHLALMADDVATRHGVVNVVYMDSLGFSRCVQSAGVFGTLHRELARMTHLAVPVKNHKFVLVGSPWVVKWVVSLFAACYSAARQYAVCMDHEEMVAFIGNEGYLPIEDEVGIRPYVSSMCCRDHRVACSHPPPRACLKGVAALEEYIEEHMGIPKERLKPTALQRLLALQEVFERLARAQVLRLKFPVVGDTGAAGGQPAIAVGSIFGFSGFLVLDMATFLTAVRDLVCENKNDCWLVNGRRSLKKATGPVYELLRQVGIHPVKSTVSGDLMLATPDQREPLGFGEFRFSMDRMRRNCNRLTIGAIRSSVHAKEPSGLGGASEDSD